MTDTVELGTREGKVVLKFQAPVEWVALDPQTAAGLGEAMARAAYEAVWGDDPTTQSKSAITEAVRIRLRNRVALMLSSMSADQPVPSFRTQAERVVDACLKEVA